MKPKIYLESSIISILQSKMPRDIVSLGHYQTTLDWWYDQSMHFDIFVSGFVLGEISQGTHRPRKSI